MTRKLATLQRIASLSPIPDADMIELVMLEGLGWKCVVQKGLHAVGDLVVFCEIDSFVDVTQPEFDWLAKQAIEWQGHRGARISTMKLRGQVSQGIVLPLVEMDASGSKRPTSVLEKIATYENVANRPYPVWIEKVSEHGYYLELPPLTDPRYSRGPWGEIGLDVTQALGIQKWERELSLDLQGKAIGSLPFTVPFYDQERVQTLWDKIVERRKEYPEEQFEVTEKLEGTSMTVYIDQEGHFGVTGRNIEFEETPDHTMWKLVRQTHLEEKLRNMIKSAMSEGIKEIPEFMALRGELIGPGVQGNYYKLKEFQFRLFDIWDIRKQEFISSARRYFVTANIDGLMHAPFHEQIRLQDFEDIESLLKLAEGQSMVNPAMRREGIVMKSKDPPFNFSFKVISNEYLLKTGG